MKALLLLIALFPIVLCFGLGYKFAEDERAFERGAERVQGTVKAIHDRTRFNGRDSEDITTVEVAYTTNERVALTAEAEVAYAVGLSAGKPVEVLYKPDEPRKIQVRAGFFNRAGKVVFCYLFGGFWVVFALVIGLFLSRMSAAAKDPGSKDRVERMKEEFKRKQAERENR